MVRGTHLYRTLAILLGLCAQLAIAIENNADKIRWLPGGASGFVSGSSCLEDIKASEERWEAKVSNPADPYIIVGPTEIDADTHKYLYLTMSTESGHLLQIFYTAGTAKDVTESASVISTDLRIDGALVTYRIDLSEISGWRGPIECLRIDLSGCRHGAPIALHAVGTSPAPVDSVNGTPVRIAAANDAGGGDASHALRERMAAWHKTNVVIDERFPNAGFLTYIKRRYTWAEHSFLAKIVPGIEREGELTNSLAARNVKVDDFPGGVVAEFDLEDVQVRTEFVPLPVGRGVEQAEGAALYTIDTNPPTPVVLEVGGGKVLQLIYGSNQGLIRPTSNQPIEGGIELNKGIALFRSGDDDFPVAMKSSGQIAITPHRDSGELLSIRMDSGSGHVLVAFSEDQARAVKLTGLDPTAARADVDKIYKKLLRSRIETPEPVIDQAFRSAIYNLEYVWVEPYGWLECIHHWVSMWHQQCTTAAEWLGQLDRSRLCTITHTEHLLPDGAIPQFGPSGHTRKDWGGSNQYWAWQVRKFWRFTADREFARVTAKVLDGIIEQTFDEYDKDDDLLLNWGLQIGNQEDYIATPFNGTTPTIEAVNMMRTRAELARGLGDTATAEAWEGRVAEALDTLREKLWMPDLGRFAYFVDPHDNYRLDGQYHTFAYPLVWNFVDPLDGYTSLRHLRDRLTGKGGVDFNIAVWGQSDVRTNERGGEVYASNNFPNHVPGTWGMQAGAAQQPWAAWALSAAGLRNETHQPLRALATWVMNDNLRGSWPEISVESTPCYFSPPAGLYIAAVVEALFGLQMNKPAGVLEVSPSFPDDWPTAKLVLDNFSAEYNRDDNLLTYTVETSEPIARQLRWRLPPARVTGVTVNGRGVDFKIEPGVESVTLSAETPSASRTTFEIQYESLEYEVRAPGSVAEGEAFTIDWPDLQVVGVDDRCGVLSRLTPTGPSSMSATVRTGLLAPYLKFGRLGQLNFSRRTFFLDCIGAGDVRFHLPVTINVLPKYEAAPVGEVKLVGAAPQVQLLIRNNTSSPLDGQGYLRAVRHSVPFAVNTPARGQQELAVTIPANLASLLSVGDNRAVVVLPGDAGAIETTLTARELFESEGQLRNFAESRITPIELPEDDMIADTRWGEVRKYQAYPHQPWGGQKPPLEALEDRDELTVPELPGVRFELAGRNFIPVSAKTSQPAYNIDLESASYRKLYLLVIPFLESDDMFAEVARVTVRGKNRVVYSRTLRLPGDLDWFWPPEIVGNFATLAGPRPGRFGLLPQLAPDQDDWPEGAPPTFPQQEFWATCQPAITPTCVMSVIEVDLGQPMPLSSLTFESLGADPAFGIVAVTAESTGSLSEIQDTAWLPPAKFRPPRTLFAFETPDAASGWRFEGEAFGVVAVPRLFSFPTLNSLGKAGEQATGRATSPEFTVSHGDAWLDLEMHGGSADGAKKLRLRLLDAQSGEMCWETTVRGSHEIRTKRAPLRGFVGKTLQLELVDESEESAYAWIGLRHATITAE